ncbi:MAG TPA: hypothetical protein DCS67_00320 [Clostridiales bacterium UBA8960]|nr:hypothetical protein [Clostridiales bacterium UBA8960]
MVHQLPKKLGLFIALIFSTSIFTCLYFEKSLVIGLSLTLAFAVMALKGYKVPVKDSLKWIVEGILSIKDIYFVVLLIGVNVSMWISSGIVPALIFYGFEIVDKVYFLLFAYVMTAVVAFFLGTGLGTLSTIGVALFTLGSSIGMPSGILVGALMSGAYVADRLSPISALVNFTIETVDVPFKAYFKKTALVMIPAAILAAFAYYLLSLRYPSQITPDDILAYKTLIQQQFVITPIVFLIPVAVLWASFRGVNSKIVLGMGIVLSAGVTLLVQKDLGTDIVQFMMSGYFSGSDSTFIKSLEIGGAFAMIEVVFIIMAGISMSTLYEKCGWIQPIIDFIEKNTKNRLGAVLNTGLLSTALNALTCDQTVGILVPGKYFKGFFNRYNYDRLTLAQVIANTGTAMAPLMPWNVNALIVLAITGVSAVDYAAFAFLNWFSFPVAIIMTAFFMKTRKS